MSQTDENKEKYADLSRETQREDRSDGTSPSPLQEVDRTRPIRKKPKRPIPYRLTPELLEGCAVLERLCFRTPWSEESLKLLLGGIGTGYAIRDGGGRVVAYGGMLYTLDEGQITNIAVHPEARRLGFGRAVTRALLDDAWQSGLECVTLEVRASNVAARSLYGSLGFEEIGTRPHFYSFPDETAILMAVTQKSQKCGSGSHRSGTHPRVTG